MWYDMIMYIYIWSDYIHFVLHSMYMYIHLHVHICHGIQKNKHNRTRNIMYSSSIWVALPSTRCPCECMAKSKAMDAILSWTGIKLMTFKQCSGFPLVSQKHSHYNGLEGSLSICLWMLYTYIYILYIYIISYRFIMFHPHQEIKPPEQFLS